MLFIFSTLVLIRYLWQLKTVVFLHWCLIRAVLLFWGSKGSKRFPRVSESSQKVQKSSQMVSKGSRMVHKSSPKTPNGYFGFQKFSKAFKKVSNWLLKVPERLQSFRKVPEGFKWYKKFPETLKGS